jgi:hypothetical protein
MLNFLTKKEKGILGAITLLGLGAVVAKGLYEYSTYKILQNINKQFKKNSWEYYD